MEIFLLKLLDMSFSAGFMILAVMLLRLLFKKAPKWSICLLWGMVALRLVCPFSFESPLSLLPQQAPLADTVMYQIQPQEPEQVSSAPVADPVEGHCISYVPASPKPMRSRGPVFWCGIIWSLVASGLILYGLISSLLLKRRVRTATRLRENLWQSEFVSTPFVLGIFRPKAYLPYGLSDAQLEHIAAHEQAHIRRGDHLIKPLGFLILSLHWFNPLVWVSYILLCRDIEAACDEKVVKYMTLEQRQSYSATLLRCSCRPSIAACPVAFGGGNVKARIKGIINYQKPGLWVILAVLVFAVTAGLCFLTEPPARDPEQPTVNTENFDRINELLDEILNDPDVSAETLTPNLYWNINYDAHRELISYGEDILNCFLPHLREAERYGRREQLMLFLCSEANGTPPAVHSDPNVWQVPGIWLTAYDRDRDIGGNRVAPDCYYPAKQLYSKTPCTASSGGQMLPDWRYETFMVTEDCIYFCEGDSLISSTRREVDWQWETVDNQWSSLATGGPCLYQNLGEGDYFLKTNKNLYLFKTDPNAPDGEQLECVYEMMSC